MDNHTITLDCNSNQACGLGQYAIDMLTGRYPGPSRTVLAKTEQFHLDSIACGISALACGCNAPHVLREEALHYAVGDPSTGVPMFGTQVLVHPEKPSWPVLQQFANGTPTVQILGTTRCELPQQVSLVTMITTLLQSQLPNWPVWTAVKRYWQ